MLEDKAGTKAVFQVIKPNLFYMVSLVAVIIVIVGAWFTHQYFEERFQHEKGDLLTVVLEQTQQSLIKWNRERQQEVSTWAQTYTLRQATISLLEIEAAQEDLKSALAQEVLREVLSPLMESSDRKGFFIISKQMINIASSRDANIGSPSVISKSSLDKVFAGESIITLPQPSKIKLPGLSGEMEYGIPTMFSLAPIRSENNDVIAILAFRLDSLDELSGIMNQANIGSTGEAYIFNKEGQLLSESRFTKDFWRTGLLETNKQSTFNVMLKVPADKNLVKDYQSKDSGVELPFTQMAASAIAGQGGINLEGYKDYRGLTVIGVWRWNEALDMGIAIEIEVDEAYATLGLSMNLVVFGTFISVYVIVVLNVVFALARTRVAKSEASLLNAQRLAHLGSWEWDLASNNLEWSEETYRIFDQNPKKFKVSYDAYLSTIHADDIETVRSAVEATLKQNKPFEVEHRVLRPDGSERIIYQRAELERDESGVPTVMHGSVLDITERKQAEHDLTLFKTTSDLVDDCLFMFDPVSLKFFYANQAAKQQLYYSEEELYNMTPVDIKPEFDEASFRSLIQPLINDPQRTLLFQTVHRRKTGSLIPVDIALQYLKPKDENARFVAVIRDFSERQQIENQLKAEKDKAEQATKTKSEFLANMSHEIRTPMNGVLGMLELLAITELNEKQYGYVRTAEGSAKSLLTIINDILDFSKIEAGHMELEKTVFNIHEVVEDSISSLSKQAEVKQLNLNCYIPAGVQLFVKSDPVRLRQILTNLISNAIKFTPTGEINLRISTISDDGNDVCLYFEVEDTGIGVEEEKYDSLFSAFTQADGSTTRKYGGTGLGLSICKQLVTMMGGSMNMSSQLGLGSIFSFTAIFTKAEQRQVRSVINLPESLNVLVVDENDTSRTILIDYLSNWGVTCFGVRSSVSMLPALEKARDEGNPYDVILMDSLIMESSGLMQLRIIKKEPDFKGINIIRLGNTTERGDASEEYVQSIDYQLNRPVRQSYLFDALLSVCGLLDKPDIEHEQRRQDDYVYVDTKVLLVDDVPTNQAVGAQMLSELGISSVLASNGREALAEMKKVDFDIIFMDCQMPVMDGYTATEIIRAQEQVESLKHLPIVALTANAMKGDREACLSSGMDDYLSKPITLSDFSEKLSHWLPHKRQSRQEMESKTAYIVKNTDDLVIENDILADDIDECSNEVVEVVLDGKVLKNLLQLAGERFGSLVESFARDITKNMLSLNEAIEQNNTEAIALACHAMKGAAANMSAVRFSKSCHDLEKQAREDNIDGIEDYMINIKSEYKIAVEALRKNS